MHMHMHIHAYIHTCICTCICTCTYSAPYTYIEREGGEGKGKRQQPKKAVPAASLEGGGGILEELVEELVEELEEELELLDASFVKSEPEFRQKLPLRQTTRVRVCFRGVGWGRGEERARERERGGTCGRVCVCVYARDCVHASQHTHTL